jgi:heterodisulfide reductase subunit B
VKAAVFWGCRILTSQYAYELSVREVLPKFGVELVDLRESVCCGDPIKSVNDFAANYLGARVLALASLTGSDNLFVPCNRCHFTISEAKRAIMDSAKTGQKIKDLLKEEGLDYNPEIKIWHTIDLLHDYVGIGKIRKAVRRPLKGLKLATHVGCQIIRYSDLGRVDDAENPRKLDELIKALGAETVDYPEKLDCCGSALINSHPDSALSLTGSKLKAVQNLGVDGLVVSCPDCQLMFDAKQKDAGTTVGAKLSVPVVYYTQLLGLALNIDEKKLGLNLNQSPAERLIVKIPA